MTQSLIFEENRDIQAVISINPEIMHGTPVFNGTRVPVRTYFDYLDPTRPLKESLQDFLEGFPAVKKSQLMALLKDMIHSLEEVRV